LAQLDKEKEFKILMVLIPPIGEHVVQHDDKHFHLTLSGLHGMLALKSQDIYRWVYGMFTNNGLDYTKT
jgi:hypothetical protein